MYIPIIEEKNDVWLPLDKTVYEIITLISKSIDNIGETPFLYNRYTGICYDVNLKIKDTDIQNGSELILI